MNTAPKLHIETLREMFAVCANERRMKEADAIAAAIAAEVRGVEGVEDWHELASEAVYVGLCIGADCAAKLAELQEAGIYKPRCEDGKPSNANARRDADKIADIYRRGLAKLRDADKLWPKYTTPQSAPVDGDGDAVDCKHEPYLGACVHCGVGFRNGVVVTSPPTTTAEAFAALRHALDNSVCYCGVDPTAIVTLRQDEARRMLAALTTPPPASQERGAGPTVRLLPKGTVMLGFNPEGELKVDCFEIQHRGNVQIVPVCSAKPLPPDDGEARARKLYEPDDITASPPSSAAESNGDPCIECGADPGEPCAPTCCTGLVNSGPDAAEQAKPEDDK